MRTRAELLAAIDVAANSVIMNIDASNRRSDKNARVVDLHAAEDVAASLLRLIVELRLEAENG